MNPAFMILVVLACVIVWALVSALYKPVGKLVYKIYKDVVDTMNEEDQEKEIEDK